jgi:hypothetical protein
VRPPSPSPNSLGPDTRGDQADVATAASPAPLGRRISAEIHDAGRRRLDKGSGMPTPSRRRRSGHLNQARTDDFRETASVVPPERIMRNVPDQFPGTVQRPSTSVPSPLSVPS